MSNLQRPSCRDRVQIGRLMLFAQRIRVTRISICLINWLDGREFGTKGSRMYQCSQDTSRSMAPRKLSLVNNYNATTTPKSSVITTGSTKIASLQHRTSCLLAHHGCNKIRLINLAGAKTPCAVCTIISTCGLELSITSLNLTFYNVDRRGSSSG